MKRISLSDLLTVIVALCAVAMTGLALWGTFKPKLAEQAHHFKNWQQYAELGHRLGAKSGRIVLIEFTDYQCPFCKRSHDAIHDLVAANPNDLTVVVRNYPISSIHEHAMAAAEAAECGARQGAFAAYYDSLFANQKSLGIADWWSLASSAGARDSSLFERCVTRHETRSIIEADMDVAKTLGIKGTPLIMVNGEVFYADTAKVSQYVKSLIRSGE